MAKIFDKISSLNTVPEINSNILINGNFDVWQRGSVFTDTGFTADRWFLYEAGDVQINRAVINSSNYLDNASYFLRSRTLGSGLGTIGQIIETINVIPLRNKYVTLSFYTRLPTGILNNFSGGIIANTYYSTLQNNIVDNYTVVQSGSITGTPAKNDSWNRYSKSFLIPANASTISIELTPEYKQKSNAIWDLAQVKLENGQKLTTYKSLPYNTELELCQRYYQKVNMTLKGGTGKQGSSNKTFGATTTLVVPVRSQNPYVSQEVNSSDSLNKISATVTNGSYLNIIGESTSDHSVLDTSFIIEDEIQFIKKAEKINVFNISRSSGSIDLSWTAPFDNGSPIKQYNVYYDSSNNTFDNLSIFTGISGTIFGTTDYSPYFFKITAVNGLGTGNISNTCVSAPLYTTSSGVSNITGVWGNNTLHLSWSQPISDGGSSITGYVIQNLSTSKNYYIPNNIPSIFSLPRNSNIEVSSTGSYNINIIPINLAGTGVSSGIIIQKTIPLIVQNISTTSITGGIILNFLPPSGDGGCDISRINIEYSSSSGFNVSTGINYIASYTPVSITGLTNFIPHYFRIRTINDIGTGNFTSTISATPTRQTGLPTAPRGISAAWMCCGSDNLNINIDRPLDDGGRQINNYTVQISSRSGYDAGYTSDFNTYNSAVAQYQINKWPVVGSNRYYLRARANTSLGSGPYTTSTILDTAAPDALEFLQCVPGNGSVTLSWPAFSNANGSSILRYIIDRSSGINFSAYTRHSIAAAVPPLTYEYVSYKEAYTLVTGNMPNNTIQYFRIAPVNSRGTGIFSPVRSASPASPITAPSQPINSKLNYTVLSTATGVDPNKVIEWERNPIRLWDQSSVGQIHSIPITAITGDFSDIPGFLNGTDIYSIDSWLQFAAPHAGLLGNGQTGKLLVQILPGQSKYIGSNRNNTISSSYDSSYYQYYNYGNSFRFIGTTGAGCTGIVFNWEAPTNNGGISITGYAWQISNGNSLFTTSTVSGYADPDTLNITQCNLFNNVYNSTIYARVAAINASGFGPWSNLSYVNPVQSPTSPSNISVSGITASGFSLRWDRPTSSGGDSSPLTYIIAYDNLQNSKYASYATDSTTGIISSILADKYPPPGDWRFTIVAKNSFYYSPRATLSQNIALPAAPPPPPTKWTFTTTGKSNLYWEQTVLSTSNTTKYTIASEYAKYPWRPSSSPGQFEQNSLTANFNGETYISKILFNGDIGLATATGYFIYADNILVTSGSKPIIIKPNLNTLQTIIMPTSFRNCYGITIQGLDAPGTLFNAGNAIVVKSLTFE
jgi:hypothetical protein